MFVCHITDIKKCFYSDVLYAFETFIYPYLSSFKSKLNCRYEDVSNSATVCSGPYLYIPVLSVSIQLLGY